MMISNHVSYLDAAVHMYFHTPSSISKIAVKNWPIIGKCAVSVGSLFVDRGDKDNKSNILE